MIGWHGRKLPFYKLGEHEVLVDSIITGPLTPEPKHTNDLNMYSSKEEMEDHAT